MRPMPTGRPRLRRTSYHRMSSEWRDESRRTDGSYPFSSADESYKPITATDRVPSDELHGKPGMSVDRGKRKYHHS